MQGLVQAVTSPELTDTAVVFRIILATIFGGTLGFERMLKRRAAGFRTYMLVCMGATVVMMTGQYTMEQIAWTDPTRLGAQVISGIGFLGAGTIMVTGQHKVKGLTTAAGLWAAACMGIALGAGFYLGATFMWLMILMIMTVLDQVQRKFIARSKRIRLYCVFENLQSLVTFMDWMKEQKIPISDFETQEPTVGTGVGAFFTLKFNEKKAHSQVLELVRAREGLTYVEEL